MSESAEFMIGRIKTNCKWYFGHEVQIITYYSAQTATWSTVVYHADSTYDSSSQGSGVNSIHIYASSKYSLRDSIFETDLELSSWMVNLFSMDNGATIPTIKDFSPRCDCHRPPPVLAVANHENKVHSLEARLQALENKLRDQNTEVNNEEHTTIPDSPIVEVGSIEATLERIESRLGTIEQRLQDRPAETTLPPAVSESPPIHKEAPVDTRSGDTAYTPLPVIVPRSARPASPMDFLWPGADDPAARPQFPSPSPYHYGTSCEDANSETHMPPSAVASERTATPKPDPGAGPAEYNRAVLRQEVNRALAAAMIGMAGLLGGGDGGGA